MKAIGFSTNDYLGNPIKLSQFKGKKILISFFRDASCPFCNLRVRELIQAHSNFVNNEIVVIVFFASTAEKILEYAGSQKPPFIIIPDPDLKIYDLYEIKKSRWGMFRTMMNPVKIIKVVFSGFFNMKSMKEKPILPSDFLIDEELNIHRSYFGKDFGGHLPIKDILSWKC